MKTAQFQNYKIFSNVNFAYSDLLNKIWDTIDTSKKIRSVAPTKEIRIKNKTQEWFDNEIVEALKLTEKYFKKFKNFKSSDRL